MNILQIVSFAKTSLFHADVKLATGFRIGEKYD
jgi:hypothetical protein